MKLDYPATERNKAPIADALTPFLPQEGTVLEIASGSGQHVEYFAQRFRALTWQPSSMEPEERASIAAYTETLQNVKAPLSLKAEDRWEVSADAILCSNMIHIASWTATLGLMKNASRILSAGAPLFLYGPFRIDGRLEPMSNRSFDASLRARDPAWGVREIREVERAAEGLELEKMIEMPANNHLVVFRSGSSGQSGST